MHPNQSKIADGKFKAILSRRIDANSYEYAKVPSKFNFIIINFKRNRNFGLEIKIRT